MSEQPTQRSDARRRAASGTPCRQGSHAAGARLTARPDGAALLPCSDLKGANVLIKKTGEATAKDPRGFVCKLADFGLARVLGSNRTHVSTSTHGAHPISAKPALSTAAARASACWKDHPA